MSLPPPSAFGLPDNFNKWYKGQDDALSWVLDELEGPKRFIAVSAPTGSGKTIISVLSSLLSGKRAIILTATKALQDQYVSTLCKHLPQTTDLKGRNAYQCRLRWDEGEKINADDGPCTVGVRCRWKDRGCTYYDALLRARAKHVEVVTTNYACWMTHGRYGEGFADNDLLILDEAHLAYDCLGGQLETEIHSEDVAPYGEHIITSENADDWRAWASRLLPIVDKHHSDLKDKAQDYEADARSVPGSLIRETRKTGYLAKRLSFLARLEGEWVVEMGENNQSAKLAPVWPSTYAEEYLFLKSPKLLFLSATLSRKTLDLLGVGGDKLAYLDMKSNFPVRNRTVVHVPTTRMNHRATDADVNAWISRIDQIIDARKDRKGIIHTVSYKRRDALLRSSKNREIMFSHGSRDIMYAVKNFKNAPPPAVMVSPSLVAGWDFPAEDCRYIIVGKVPYPDVRAPVLKARQKLDKDWAAYQAMMTLVQSSGRGVRAATDWCETLVIDDDWVWFWMKYKNFAPRWFADAVRFDSYLPQPINP